MKYLKEAEEILKEILIKKPISDEGWKNFLIELEQESAINLQSLAKDIEIGVNNGFSVEIQLELIRKKFKSPQP